MGREKDEKVGWVGMKVWCLWVERAGFIRKDVGYRGIWEEKRWFLWG